MTHRPAQSAAAEKVIVAVKAEKVISKAALAWALTHVVHPGDGITLLAVLSGHKSGKKSLWSFPKLTGDCKTVDLENFPERASQISDSCSQMVLQLHDQIEVRVQIKVVSSTPTGAVASVAKDLAASWVIMDKKLKQEQRHCLEELQCNIVVMKGSRPKVLRLNLGSSDELQTPFFSAPSSPSSVVGNSQNHKMKHSTPVSSPERTSSSNTRTTRQSSISSPDTVVSPYLVYEKNPLFEGPARENYSPLNHLSDHDNPPTRPRISKTSNHKNVFYIPQNHSANEKSPTSRNCCNSETTVSALKYKKDMIGEPGLDQTRDREFFYNSSIRQAVSLGRTSSTPPPLCSLCQHKAPVFGKPPKCFNYEELIEATDGFSDLNFLAEGGFGTVHRGVLRDGQVVAVKKLKFVGSQGDIDFCREVRVLSCAQHRNVVLLIGFCVEGGNRLLVYEYVCNGFLDFHLHGNKRTPLDWHTRQKIAIGAARGLRYLHEDCRVGCIVHRDMRPSNILLTHDYEPLVADFGLARLHNEWDVCNEQVVGTSGHLAPEYFNGGKVTEKVDIYAFGLVLLELITGQRTIDLQCEPAHVLANIDRLIDPCLASDRIQTLVQEVRAMHHAAFLCLQTDPECRPPMSKVLRVLEGGDGGISLSLDLNTVGSRSGRMQGLTSNTQLGSRRHFRKLSQ